MSKRGDNIYKRKDGRWEGRYVKGSDIKGKSHLGYVYGKTQKEVKEKLKIKKTECQNTTPLVSSSMTLYDWIKEWIPTQRQIKDTTKMMYYSHLKNHIKDKIGKVILKKLNEDILQNFIYDETGKYSAKTVHSVFSMLKLSLETAHKKSYVGTIYTEIRLPKIGKKSLRVFTKQEQKRFEAVIFRYENRYDIGILVCLYTGIRIGELCALKWENINLRNGTIDILETVQRVANDDEKDKRKTKIKFDDPKSIASVRTIPIPKFLVKELKKYQLESGYILRDNGKFTDTRNISRRFKQILKEAKIDDMNYHILRHTFATRGLELGMDTKTLSEILDHSSVNITLNLYAHSLPEHKRKEMEKFGGLFKRPSD